LPNLIKRAYNKFYTFPRFKIRKKKSFEDFLNKLNFDINDYFEISNEIINEEKFNSLINKEFANAGLDITFPLDNISWPYFLYYLLRKKKPEIIVETGVWYGISTLLILSALNKNEKGFLYSIDLPAYFETGGYTDENPYLEENKRTSSLPPEKAPGFIVPEYLKDKWKLILGDTKSQLPVLFDELKSVDIFLHDSLHSYENMIFEFELSKKHLKKGGYILSDNIDWHSAFYDFCKNHKLGCNTYLSYYESPKLKHNFGAICI
jgi:predicted O-methyltransferase YrrM